MQINKHFMRIFQFQLRETAHKSRQTNKQQFYLIFNNFLFINSKIKYKKIRKTIYMSYV